MSDLSRPGYNNRRSPSALAAAVLLNGSVVALIIAIPMSIDRFQAPPPLVIHDVRMAPPPPKREEKKPDPVRQAIQRPVDAVTPTPTPTALDNPFDQIGKGIEVAINYPPPDFGIGTASRPADPPLPVLVKARPDPRYADAFHPDYPPSLVREGLEGDVTVRVTIDPRGRVIAVEMVKASNPVFFEETKRQALKSWRFVPATRDGTAVESIQTMTVHFRLEA